MSKKKPIPMPGFNEAVATLGDWAAKLDAVEVRPAADSVAGYCLKAFDANGECVGVLRWSRGRRWHVAVGMGSWSVTPANRWSVEEMDRDTKTAISKGETVGSMSDLDALLSDLPDDED